MLRHRVLRMIAGSTATSNFFSSMTMAVYLLYAVRERHYSAGLIGLVFTLGNIGVARGRGDDRACHATRSGSDRRSCSAC